MPFTSSHETKAFTNLVTAEGISWTAGHLMGVTSRSTASSRSIFIARCAATRDLNARINHGLVAVIRDDEIVLSTADGEFRAGCWHRQVGAPKEVARCGDGQDCQSMSCAQLPIHIERRYPIVAGIFRLTARQSSRDRQSSFSRGGGNQRREAGETFEMTLVRNIAVVPR
ncbi:hypothetical protein ATN38_24305 [Rhodococcus sp. FH8]|jgi:hypothetical protein|nr:hypothetical protein [Rhodococcus sp. FH8]